MKLLPLATLLLLVAFSHFCHGEVKQLHNFKHFITRQNHQLYDGNKIFRFAGLHAPELHRIEDDAKGKCSADKRGWGQYFKWPTRDEQENWIKALVKSGHKAMRIYVLSVEQEDDVLCQRETHILKPLTHNGMPRLNEKAMQVYDQMIALSGENGLRLILPFIDHWQWWGGREQLALFYQESPDDFYRVDSRTYQAYLSIIDQVINRVNTINGIPYSQDKTIMAWETGNELKFSTAEFVTQTAAFIKAKAPQQLVIDGNYLSILPSSINDPNIDIISNHFYTVNGNNNPQTIKNNLETIAGKKAYFVGEFGLETVENLSSVMQAAVHTEVNGAKAVGAFIWGFRGHRHNGGFYWHKEGNGPHYSYRLPGFIEADDNNEIAVVNLVRLAQAQMNGQKTAPPLPIPEAPKLRPITQSLELRWLGAPLGQFYRIERKVDQNNWQVIADNVSDGLLLFDPKQHVLFKDNLKDEGILKGKTLEYRVIAKNESGESVASNSEFITLHGSP